MKIKTVCELTGLSDRAVRYYIEECLIFPAYTENYLGRKSFDFSDRDIKALNDIAVLRKFDFTIEEIRAIILDAEASKNILIAVKNRTQAAAASCQDKLAALSNINTGKAYSIAELAKELSKPSSKWPVHNETAAPNIAKIILSVLRGILIGAVVWLPVALSLFGMIISCIDYRYPVWNPLAIGLTILSLLPSFAMLIMSEIKYKSGRIVRRVLLLLCVLSVPVSFILSLAVVTKSETTDFRNYRKFDADCLANRNIVFQELFPTWPHYFEHVKQDNGNYAEVYLDSHYYYHYFQGFDYTYDIYAEWPLDEASYAEEVSRASALFQDTAAGKTYGYKYTEIQKGDYTCLILYNGDEPFNPVTNSYDYLIFAHNDNTKTVRYIYCDSLENGADQPYYLSLDW